MPVGPHILWPEKARKSQPISCTSSGRCPALCAASTSVVTPSWRARAHKSATGLIVPSELEMCVIANSFTFRRQALVQAAQVEQADVAGDGQEDELRARALGQQLPGNDVAVVLHLREQDRGRRL